MNKKLAATIRDIFFPWGFEDKPDVDTVRSSVIILNV
jgi:hypothetical protein